MPVTSVVRIEQFGDTVVARRDVGRNWRHKSVGIGSRLARRDPELAHTCGVGGNVMDGDGVNPRQRWGLGPQAPAEFVHPRAFSLYLEKYCARIVADESGQAEVAGDAV